MSAVVVLSLISLLTIYIFLSFIVDGELVHKDAWLKFITWFSPLTLADDLYQNGPEAPKELQGYQFNHSFIH